MCKVNMSPLDACEECSLKCRLIHKKKRDPSSIVSSFFKVMIDAHFLKFLPVPPRFAPRLATFAGRKTYVEDSSGRKWPVTLSHVNNSVGFQRGWHAFSSDHGIELGDIVIVNYILDSHFVVQIFGKTGCEKLCLPSMNNTVPNKRIKTTRDPVARDGSFNAAVKDSTTFLGSGLRMAATPSNMELKGCSRARLDDCALKKNKEGHQIDVSTEELSLMMMNRDIPVAEENERCTVFDMFAPEISNIKLGGKVDNVQKGNRLSSVEDRVGNHVAFEGMLKDTFDTKMAKTNENRNNEALRTTKNGHKSSSGTRQGNGDSETNITRSEGATNLKAPEQLLDYDTNFEDSLWGSLDVKMSKISAKVNPEFKCTSEIDRKCNIVTPEENKVFAINSTELQSEVRESPKPLPKATDLSSRASNAIQHNLKEMHISAKQGAQRTTYGRQIYGSDGKSMSVEPALTNGGSKSKLVASNPGQSLKAVKKERAQGVGLELKPNITRVSAGEVRRTVKAEPVADHATVLSPLEVACLVTPDSESFLELPKGLPFLEFDEKVVLLRDTGGRFWPVLYHEKDCFKALVYGWESFRKANQIQSGDKCVFALVDRSQFIYGVEIIRK